MINSVTQTRRDAGRPRGTPVIDAVLAAARDEIIDAGVDRLSVDRVAQRAQVNKTSVYRRWPTREALIAAAMEGMLNDLNTTADTGTLRGDLLAILMPIAALAAKPEGAALLRAAMSSPAAEEIAALAARKFAANTPILSEIIKRGIQHGEWDPQLAPELLIFTIVGAIIHRTLLEHADPTGNWLEAVIDLTLNGATPRQHQRPNRAIRASDPPPLGSPDIGQNLRAFGDPSTRSHIKPSPGANSS